MELTLDFSDEVWYGCFIEDAVEGVVIVYIYVYVCSNLINPETSRPYYSSRVLVVVYYVYI